MTAAVIKSQDGYVTIHLTDYEGGVDITLFVRGEQVECDINDAFCLDRLRKQGFQCVLDREATLELIDALKEATEGG